MATEVVLFGKLGENEVVEAIAFGKNRKKNYAGLNTLPVGMHLSVENITS
jgi:hypothetical protein